MMPWKSYDCTGALAGVLLRDRGCVCEDGEWDFCLRASLPGGGCEGGFGFRVGDGPRCRGSADRCGDGELEAGCGALVALLLAPLGASDERAWPRDRESSCDGESALSYLLVVQESLVHWQ